MSLNKFYYMLLLLVAFQIYYFQIFKLNINDSKKCLQAFKSNNVLGFLVLLSIIIGKI